MEYLNNFKTFLHFFPQHLISTLHLPIDLSTKEFYSLNLSSFSNEKIFLWKILDPLLYVIVLLDYLWQTWYIKFSWKKLGIIFPFVEGQ